jgi:DNA-binding transcriptional LysR family regulator
MVRGVQLQQLAYFVAVAETRHFTRAAVRVRVAQPSLSKQIHTLERELGAPLFSRARGNVTLTPAGEALLPLARRILADVETARLDVQDLVGLRRGRVRLGATPSLCTGLLPEVLADFRRRYPGISLHVEEGGSRDLIRQLAQGSLDLALIILRPQSHDPALYATPLLREDLVIASPADRAVESGIEPAVEPGIDPPALASPARIADLRDVPMVMFRDGYDLRDVTLAACRAEGFEPRFAVEGGEMGSVLRFVEAGLGVAVVPSTVTVGRDRLRATPFAPPGLSRIIALAHRRDVEPPRAAREFQAILLNRLASPASLPPGVSSLP